MADPHLAAAASVEPPKLDLSIEPHEGLVRLQQATALGPAALKHIVTMESKTLPPACGTWVLAFAPDGFGAVSDTDSDVVLTLEDLFVRQLAKDEHGHGWILEGIPPNQTA